MSYPSTKEIHATVTNGVTRLVAELFMFGYALFERVQDYVGLTGDAASATGSITAQVKELRARFAQPLSTYQVATVDSTAGPKTWTAAQVLAGLLLRDPNGGDRTDVLPTAALVVAALAHPVVNQGYLFTLRNTGSTANTVTLSAGTGGSTSGTMAVAQGIVAQFLLRLTNVSGGTEAYVVYALGSTAAGGGSARTVLDDNGGTGYTAANGMALADADVVVFSNGGTITNFAAPAGPRAPTTIECQDSVTFIHGSGISLVNGLNATVGNVRNETITLEYDGFNWYEVARGAAVAGNNPSPVHVTNSIDESISNSTLTLLTFDTERYDASGQHDTVTNNSRLTAAVAGKYRVWANVLWATNGTGLRVLECWHNNTWEVDRDSVPAVAGGVHYTKTRINVTVALAVNDYVEVKAYQTSGGSLAVQVVDRASPEFGMEWVGS